MDVAVETFNDIERWMICNEMIDDDDDNHESVSVCVIVNCVKNIQLLV